MSNDTDLLQQLKREHDRCLERQKFIHENRTSVIYYEMGERFEVIRRVPEGWGQQHIMGSASTFFGAIDDAINNVNAGRV